MRTITLVYASSDQEVAAEVARVVAPHLRLQSFAVRAEPFVYPKLGRKEFFEVNLTFVGEAQARSFVVKRLPDRDAVQALTGVSIHREVGLVESGLVEQLKQFFVVPYLGVLGKSAILMNDVRPALMAFPMGMISEERLDLVLAALARMHASFWGRNDLLEAPWLLKVGSSVERCFACFVEIIGDADKRSPLATYVNQEWPWLRPGIEGALDSLASEERKTILSFFFNPWPLLKRLEPYEQTLCHFDFDPRNLGWDSESQMPVVIDWEMAGRGAPTYDLVRLLSSQGRVHEERWKLNYIEKLEDCLGFSLDRSEWLTAYDLSRALAWSIFGVVFAAVVNAPDSPIPEALKAVFRPQALVEASEIASLVGRLA